MTRVFLDTVGLLAVWDENDQWHLRADAAFQDVHSRKCRILTTDAVLYECGNAAARRPYRAEVNALRNWLVSEKLL